MQISSNHFFYADESKFSQSVKAEIIVPHGLAIIIIVVGSNTLEM